MKSTRLARLVSALAIVLPGLASPALARPGPDVIVGDLIGVQHYGAVGGVRGYAVGTTSCNIGTKDLLWVSSTNQHPVIAQNMYRLSGGRLEQIGQSWLKHGFTALTQNLCGTCNGHGGSVLGVGCSDPYSASLNGSQTRLGPRSEVNATTGFYPYPYQIGWQQSGNATYKRLQVPEADLLTPGAIYLVEGQYITGDDAMAGNGLNNASYRRVIVNTSTFAVTNAGVTERTKPAIMAWRDHGLGVNTPDPSVLVQSVDYVEQGLTARYWVASKATQLAPGRWRYDYAVQNLNSHRSCSSLSIPIGFAALAEDATFHAPAYHSGEPWSNDAWTMQKDGSHFVFRTGQTFQQNPNANALRWGTMYSFSFESNFPPADGTARLGLFRPGQPGQPDSLEVNVWAPVESGGCYPDCTQDGVLNVNDYACFQTSFALGNTYADCNSDNLRDINDYICFQTRFALGCP